MASLGNALAFLSYAGLGAGLGSIGAAIVSSRSGKGEARAHAADMISNAASVLADQQSETIERLVTQNDRMRKAIILLTDVMDDLLPQLALPKTELAKLKKATNAAKLAV